jgi:glycosyltransferase involved in cell wall biosynthesis
MSDGPIGSVLIPAHNEEAVIGRCLDHLFEAIDPASLEVAVVCNGCHDGTAAVARASGHPALVIELDVASKPAALRAGDRALRAFPRLYLDADVVLRGATARQVLEHLGRPGAQWRHGRRSATTRPTRPPSCAGTSGRGRRCRR